VKNFVLGFLLGGLCAYWYFSEGALFRGAVDDWWARASAPPPTQRRAK
jgi:hypothetical protein